MTEELTPAEVRAKLLAQWGPAREPGSMTDAALSTAKQRTERLLSLGFVGKRDIVADVVSAVVYEFDVDSATAEATITPLVEEARLRLLQEQVSWPETTDCDRLEWVFDALNDAGIVARQDFCCCMSCGMVEIADEIEAARTGGGAVIGWTFYHRQDTENAAETGSMYLAYGSADGDESGGLEVGRCVVAGLERVGLQVKWSGNLADRILVTGLDWKKRGPREVTVATRGEC